MSVPPSAPSLELTVVIPCLNEALTITGCVREAVDALAASGIAGEVVVADNGSTDGSQDLATRAGARVVPIAIKGSTKHVRSRLSTGDVGRSAGR